MEYTALIVRSNPPVASIPPGGTARDDKQMLRATAPASSHLSEMTESTLGEKPWHAVSDWLTVSDC